MKDDDGAGRLAANKLANFSFVLPLFTMAFMCASGSSSTRLSSNGSDWTSYTQPVLGLAMYIMGFTVIGVDLSRVNKYGPDNIRLQRVGWVEYSKPTITASAAAGAFGSQLIVRRDICVALCCCLW